MRNNDRAGAFFTGYYAPELHGARRKTDRFRYPLYLRPRDLVTVDLGEFKRDLAGRRIGGRIAGGAFRPYFDRTAIDDGALAMRGLELLWVDDPLALFFLQIQGSGTVILPDGSRVRVGYAADNGFDYTPIGRVLVARGALPADGVSLQSIRDWLRAHPEEARGVMDQDESYVFFRVLPGDVVGSLGVPLTPGRSIAVDPKFVPLGLPLYAATLLPALPETGERATLFGRVFVAEDTGGAIKGPLRADLFWGSGPRAEALAGRMRQPGRLYLLLPRGH